MSNQSSSAAYALEAPPAPESSLDERWAAWVERGHRHELAVARKLRVAALGAAVIGLIAALFFGLAAGAR